MIKDFLNRFSNGQALLASAASESVLDFGAAGDAYEGLWLLVRVGTILDSAEEDATLTITWQSDTLENFGSGSVKTLFTSKTFTEAECLGDTYLLAVKVPQGCLRWNRLYYTVAGHNFTSGTIDAFLVKDKPTIAAVA